MLTDMHSHPATQKVAYTLYLCHLLSTWNSRMYEFAAVVFIAAAFPESLIASSILGLVMSLSVLLFASLLGTWVDRGESRLATLIYTVTANRISIIAACVCWYFTVSLQDQGSPSPGTQAVNSTAGGTQVEPSSFTLGLKTSLFILILVLSVVERLSWTANLFSIERDWVPAMTTPDPLKSHELPPEIGLTELNAAMSRIDLTCKLLSPIAMSAFISAVGSVRVGILSVLTLNTITWPAEIWSARRVWKSSDQLQKSKKLGVDRGEQNVLYDDPNTSSWRLNKLTESASQQWWQRSRKRTLEVIRIIAWGISTWLHDYRVNLHMYFSHSVWLPSMALSILHFSVLNFSATLVVYLLNSGFPLNLITMAKVLSALAELGSTFFTPWGVRKIDKMWATYGKSPIYGDVIASTIGDEDRLELLSERGRNDCEGELASTHYADIGVTVLGLWSLIQMLVSLVPACLALWVLSFRANSSSQEKPPPPTIITVILLTTIPLSRFGRWTNHLTTQQLTQTLVPSSNRSVFAGVETSFVSLFGLGHWVITAIWSKHEQFRWLALGSVAAVGCSVGIYYWWLSGGTKGRRSLSFFAIPTIEPS